MRVWCVEIPPKVTSALDTNEKFCFGAPPQLSGDTKVGMNENEAEWLDKVIEMLSRSTDPDVLREVILEYFTRKRDDVRAEELAHAGP